MAACVDVCESGAHFEFGGVVIVSVVDSGGGGIDNR